MKKRIDLVKLWIRKAENDLVAAEHLLTVRPHTPYDTICFHAQQCAEKYLKAFLVFHGIEFGKTHDLEELTGLASEIDESFLELKDESRWLTDYAVEVRYPMLMEEPKEEEARSAIRIAIKIKELVLNKLHLGEKDD